MQTMLQRINALPGVLGSMACDAAGRPLAQAMPPEHLDANLREAAAAAAESLRALHHATGTATHLDLHYSHRRILIVPWGDGSVVLVCDKAASTRQLLPRVQELVARGTAVPAGDPAPAARPPPSAPVIARSATGERARPAPPAPRDVPAWRRVPVLAGAGAAVALVAALVLWIALRPGATEAGSSAAREAAAQIPAPAAEPTIVLRVGGAKSFAAELAPALARAYLESIDVEDVFVTKHEPYRFTVQGRKDGEPWAVAILGTNTADGFDWLADGRLDVAMAGRRIKPEWQQKLDAFGPMTVPGREHVVALSGIAVIVNPANLVPQLSRDQLTRIFSGAVTDWSEVTGRKGGAPSPIHVYAGDDKMGLTDLFRFFILDKAPYAAQANRLATLKAIDEAVASDPQGIGYVTLPFVRGSRAVPVSEGDESPLVPTAFTLATEDYFLTHRLYFYTLPRPENPHLQKFVRFALSAEGQAVVKKSGYVELSVASAPREAPRGAPPEYVRLTRGATRLSSTFRFEPNSSDFDSRALVDLERVAAHLVEGRVNGPAVRILGFADSQGRPAANLGLSQARAAQVAKALAQRGITGVSVEGFGSALPVASNLTQDGRQRNRRVEVWVSQ